MSFLFATVQYSGKIGHWLLSYNCCHGFLPLCARVCFPRHQPLLSSPCSSTLHSPTSSNTMSCTMDCSLSQSRHPGRPLYAEEDNVGEETCFPLIICDECGMERVIELRSKTNTNPGHMFFKCPRNNPWVSICSSLVLVGCSHRLDLVC